MSLTAFSVIPLLLLIGWIIAEFRGGRMTRILLGVGTMASIAVMAFLWGGFVEGFSHAEFVEPHDGPADAARMDAAINATNTVTR